MMLSAGIGLAYGTYWMFGWMFSDIDIPGR